MKNINLFVPYFRKEEILSEIAECLDMGWTGLGFKTQRIEEEWKKFTGLPYAHFLSSNTVGLHLALKILKDANKWKEGDEVITTPLTFVSTNHSILHEKLKPVFADVDSSLCLDPISVESRITKRTKAVLFVGIGGNTGQLSEIVTICKKHRLKLILDAAHMAGTITATGKHAGHEADVSVFSFQAVKNLPTADSGMICFANEDYDQLARKLSWLGIDKDTYQRTNDKGTYKWEYDVVDPGFKYHGNSIMASMAMVGLKYLATDNEVRAQICERYEKGFERAGIDYVRVSNETVLSSRHLFQIRVKNRNLIMEYLNSQGIYPGVHYRDNTNYSMYSDQFGRCPNSHAISEEVVSLPLHLRLGLDEVDYVIEQTIKANSKYNG